jgi:hypothetical protein
MIAVSLFLFLSFPRFLPLSAVSADTISLGAVHFYPAPTSKRSRSRVTRVRDSLGPGRAGVVREFKLAAGVRSRAKISPLDRVPARAGRAAPVQLSRNSTPRREGECSASVHHRGGACPFAWIDFRIETRPFPATSKSAFFDRFH